jgi:Skp family chaperone for outer membrane proteins
MFVKKIILLFFLVIFCSFSYAENKLAYIDFDVILSQSNASKSLLKQLKDIEKTQYNEFEKKEQKLKDDEKKILSSKNILSGEEYKKKVNVFRKNIINYQTEKKNIIFNLEEKRNQEIMSYMKLISPLINEYMNNNSIDILLEKKNIFIAKSNHDITQHVLEIINKEIKEFRILNDE